jgi:hypothetical protein
MKSLMYMSNMVIQALGIILFYTNQIDIETWQFMILVGLGFYIVGNTEK